MTAKKKRQYIISLLAIFSFAFFSLPVKADSDIYFQESWAYASRDDFFQDSLGNKSITISVPTSCKNPYLLVNMGFNGTGELNAPISPPKIIGGEDLNVLVEPYQYPGYNFQNAIYGTSKLRKDNIGDNYINFEMNSLSNDLWGTATLYCGVDENTPIYNTEYYTEGKNEVFYNEENKRVNSYKAQVLPNLIDAPENLAGIYLNNLRTGYMGVNNPTIITAPAFPEPAIHSIIGQNSNFLSFSNTYDFKHPLLVNDFLFYADSYISNVDFKGQQYIFLLNPATNSGGGSSGGNFGDNSKIPYPYSLLDIAGKVYDAETEILSYIGSCDIVGDGKDQIQILSPDSDWWRGEYTDCEGAGNFQIFFDAKDLNGNYHITITDFQNKQVYYDDHYFYKQIPDETDCEEGERLIWDFREGFVCKPLISLPAEAQCAIGFVPVYQRNGEFYCSTKENIDPIWGIVIEDERNILGLNTREMACSLEDWKTPNPKFNFGFGEIEVSAFNLTKLKCQTIKSFLDITFSVSEAVKKTASATMENVFPINIPTQINRAWRESEFLNLPADLTFLDMTNEENALTGEFPKEWLGTNENLTFDIFSKDLASQGSEKALLLFANFKKFSVYLQWFVFLFGTLAFSNHLMATMSGTIKKENDKDIEIPISADDILNKKV